MKRVERIFLGDSTMQKKALAVAIAAAMAAPMAAQAAGLQFKVYGQADRMIRYADNGVKSDTQFLDNGASDSRLGISGSTDLANGMKAGVNLEMHFSANNPWTGSANVHGTGGGYVNSIRQDYAWFSGSFGKVLLGNTWYASALVDYPDQTGVWLADEFNSATDQVSTVTFRTKGGAASGFTVGNVMPAFDQFRGGQIQYQSPAIGPVTLKADVANGAAWDVAAWSTTSIMGGSLAANFGWNHPGRLDNNTNGTFLSGVQFLASQGTFIGGSYDYRSAKSGYNPRGWFVKGGQVFGKNTVSISYGEKKGLMLDAAGNPYTAHDFGLGYHYAVVKGVELYAGYHHLSVDAPAGQPKIKDINYAIAGTRIKF